MPLNTKQYSDFDINFIPHPITGDLVKKVGAAAVVQSVMNLVQTNHYERLFNPQIGGNARKLLFDPIDNIVANLLAQEIRIVIANFEPRATVIGVYVQADIDGSGYNATIEFSIVTLTDPITVSIFLERLR